MAMKKLKDNLLHIGLIITILISILFSALIWINPAPVQKSLNQEDNTAVTQDTNYDINDIYFPTNIIYNQTAKKQYLVSSKKVDLTRNIKTLSQKWSTKHLTKITQNSQTKYLKYLTLTDAAVLRYPDKVSTALFTSKKKINYEFNWIVIALNTNRVYFLNDEKQAVYQLKTNSLVNRKAKKLIIDERLKKVPFTYQRLGKHYVIAYPNEVSVPRYSYLINKENAGVYIGRLLGTSNSGSISTREQYKETVYSDDNGKKLSVNSQTSEVVFNDYNQVALKKQTFYTNLQANFKLLNTLGVTLDDIRYSSYNANTNTITYRSYINGYPIIAKNCYGTFKVQIKASGTKQLEFSLDTLQIPVPANGQEKVLPKTQTILEQLQQAEVDLDNISDLSIGYAWSDNASAKMVIDLTPTYFVKYRGTWFDYQDLLAGNYLPLE